VPIATTERFQRLRALGERMTSDPRSPFHVPGIAVVVARAGEEGQRVFLGTDAAGTPIQEHTRFPLASASKLATGVALLRLVDRQLIDLDAPLARYLPRAAAARDGVTIRTLLSHTSGLPLEIDSGRVAYDHSLTWAKLAAACADTPLSFEPRTRVQYSNVAYGLLGVVMERVSGTDFRALIEASVFEPLAISASLGRVVPTGLARIDGVDSPHVGTDLEPFNSEFSQQLVMPWSGVVTTADGLLALLQVYAGGRPDLVRAETVAHARTNQAGDLGGGFGTTDAFIGFNRSRSITWARCPWGLAVEVRGEKRPHWTPATASPASFGQIGSSGCLAWCDPDLRVSWAVLAPRTTDNGWLLRHGAALGSAILQPADVVR
jgi:beta-lactamase class C